MNKNLIVLLAVLLPLISWAHPGHDHSHWSSSFVHTVLFLSITGALLLGFKLWRNRVSKKNALDVNTIKQTKEH